MTKVVVCLCDYCKRVIHEFTYKSGDCMDNVDLCDSCRARGRG